MSTPLLYDPQRAEVFVNQGVSVIPAANSLLLSYKELDAVVGQTTNTATSTNIVSAQRYGNVMDINFAPFQCDLAADIGTVTIQFSNQLDKLRDLLPKTNTAGLTGRAIGVVSNAVIKHGATTSTYLGTVPVIATVLVNTSTSVGQIKLTFTPPPLSYTTSSAPVFAAGTAINFSALTFSIPVYQTSGQGPW